MYVTNPKRRKILLVNPTLAWFLLGFSEPVLCKQCKYKQVLALLSPLCWPWITPSLGCEAIERVWSLPPRGVNSSWRDGTASLTWEEEMQHGEADSV